MLFHEFFPRLCERAKGRYGIELTERQFRDWREVGLLPGPAEPIGRGRGRSPERHWPVASYRRALRICRFQSWGAKRQSQWWLGLWFAGEGVLPSTLRMALRREYRINRRPYRTRAGSATSRVTNAKIVRREKPGQYPDAFFTGMFCSDSPMLPHYLEQVFEFEFDHLSSDDPRNRKRKELFHNIIASSVDPEMAADIRAELKNDDINLLWRPGYLAIGENEAGDYFQKISPLALQISFHLLKVREKLPKLNFIAHSRTGMITPNGTYGFVIAMRACHHTQLQYRIKRFLQVAFEVSADEADGLDLMTRLNANVSNARKLALFITNLSIEAA